MRSTPEKTPNPKLHPRSPKLSEESEAAEFWELGLGEPQLGLERRACVFLLCACVCVFVCVCVWVGVRARVCVCVLLLFFCGEVYGLEF